VDEMILLEERFCDEAPEGRARRRGLRRVDEAPVDFSFPQNSRLDGSRPHEKIAPPPLIAMSNLGRLRLSQIHPSYRDWLAEHLSNAPRRIRALPLTNADLIDIAALAELRLNAPEGCRTDATGRFLVEAESATSFPERSKQTCDKGAA
jgi:hypothetical protein